MTLHITRADRKRKSLIAEAEAQSIQQLIKTMPTIEEKRELVVKHNPYFYIFGLHLGWRNPYEESEDDCGK